jgi:hypothetical protein
MLLTVAGLNPRICGRLSVLCIKRNVSPNAATATATAAGTHMMESYSYTEDTTALRLVRFIKALCPQLISIGLSGDGFSQYPLISDIVDGVQQIQFPCLRALYVDPTTCVTLRTGMSWNTFGPIADLLAQHDGLVHSLSLPHISGGMAGPFRTLWYHCELTSTQYRYRHGTQKYYPPP